MNSPVLIDPAAVYDGQALRKALRISEATLAEGRRNGLLRFAKAGSRTLYRGEWVIKWLENASGAGGVANG
jgi:hypothetical protein